jgi:hypothetical protein
VGRVSFVVLILTFCREFTWKRIPIVLRNLVMTSACPQSFRIFRWSTPGSSHINVMYAATASVEIPIFKTSRKFTLEKNLTKSVGMASTGIQNLKITHESTLDRSHTNATCVARASAIDRFLMFIRESTQERNLTNVRSVVKASVLAQILEFIRESTLERDATNAINVERVSFRVQNFIFIRESMEERKTECKFDYN